MPKIPLSALIGLVTASAGVMAVFHQAVTTKAAWAILVSIFIAAALLPILFYVGSFALASLFAVVTSGASRYEPPPVHVPTTKMPDDQT